jgi:hypothetical protein
MPFRVNYQWYVIDASKSWQIALWADVLGVTDEVLLAAIDQVGNEVYSVRDYLNTDRAEYH